MERKGKVTTLTKKPWSKDGIVNSVCKSIFLHTINNFPFSDYLQVTKKDQKRMLSLQAMSVQDDATL